MSHVCELWKDHEDVGVVLLVVSLDRDEAELMSIIESSSCPGFLSLSETYTAASNSARHYEDGGLPWQTFVIDRDGIIYFANHLGRDQRQ